MRTYDEINEKILTSKVKVLTALEAKSYIKEKGVNSFFSNIDVVTCASFEMHTNALLYLSFGQTDPMIYFQEVLINGVPAYPTGPTDIAISCVSSSKDDINYSGANVLEDLLLGKNLHLKAIGKHLGVFPNREFETWFNLNDVNQSRLLLNQSLNQNNIVACNSSDHDINSHMGTLIGKLENSTFNSSTFLNPLINDPFCKTIGVGTSVWVAGSKGVIVGHGSHHNPNQKRNEHGIPVGPSITLSSIVDISSMNPKWVKPGHIQSFGPVLFIGVAIAIPVLDKEIAEHLSITDNQIHTTIVDFSIPRRTKPTFGQCTYFELRTSTVSINNKPTLTAPLTSMAYSIESCNELKNDILNKKFILSKSISGINMNVELKKLDAKLGELV